MPRPNAGERGSALLVAMIISLVLLMLAAGLFVYTNQEHERASRSAKTTLRMSCAQAGLQIARNYFASNVSNWNTYLADPHHYDPVDGTWIHASPLNSTPADPSDTTFQTTAPYATTLFYDLDGDAKPDVYIYIRDNQDEMLPAPNDWTHDNDQNVFVGAVCISQTMVPRHPDGTVDTAQLSVESLLSYNTPGNAYASQSGGGASGTGNVN